MEKQRLEAFSDGVIAIIITIMVLELKTPAGASFADLAARAPVFLAYALSFANVGLSWNNYHHLLSAAERVDGRVLWANLFLLFWLSLVPFAIRWVDETGFGALPTASYGAVLAMAVAAYMLLEKAIIGVEGNARLAAATGSRWKEKATLLLYVAAVGAAFVRPWIAIAVYIGVAVIWFVPDRRIESILKNR